MKEIDAAEYFELSAQLNLESRHVRSDYPGLPGVREEAGHGTTRTTLCPRLLYIS